MSTCRVQLMGHFSGIQIQATASLLASTPVSVRLFAPHPPLNYSVAARSGHSSTVAVRSNFDSVEASVQGIREGAGGEARDSTSKRTLKLTSRGIVWSDDEVEQLLAAARGDIGEWHWDMRKWRRQIHAYPELAFQEKATAGMVADLLEEWGYTVERGLGGTGVVGTLTAGNPPQDRSAIMLRADMDALPIAEGNSFEHRSRRDCAMHACGHDGHTAMLLGAARHLAETQCFEGTVHLVFQPAEEGTPTENEFGRTGSGAAAMMEEGLLDKYPVRAAFGLHNWPGLAVGRIAVHSGPVMAGVENFIITVEGTGCHAAMPHLGGGSDAVVCGAQLVTALQTLVSRRLDPQDSAVVSVTQFQAGDAFNVIPPQAVLKGTLRTFRESTREAMRAGMEQMASHMAAAHGCSASVEFVDQYPATVNTRDEAAECARAARAVVGTEQVDHDTVPPSMGAEDFGYILQRVPGCYAWIGNGPTEGGCMLHNPRYDFNDDILALGAGYWVQIVKGALPLKSG